MSRYALLDNRGAIVRYPIDLRREFPNVSFQRDPPDNELAQINVARVRETARPDSAAQAVIELSPEKEADGHLHQRWQATPSSERLEALKTSAQAEVRALGQEDWIIRTAVLSSRFTDALAAIGTATTSADIRAVLDSLRR